MTLLSAQAVQRRVERRGGGQAAAGNFLVLTSTPTLSPETKDVGHAWQGTCGRWGGERECRQELLDVEVLFCCVLPDRALQVFPVLGCPSPSVFSLNFMGGAWACRCGSISCGGASLVTTDSSPCRRCQSETLIKIFNRATVYDKGNHSRRNTSSPLECEEIELRCASHWRFCASSCFWLLAASFCLRRIDLWDFLISPASASSGQRCARKDRRARWVRANFSGLPEKLAKLIIKFNLLKLLL